MKRRGPKPKVGSLYKNGQRCTFYIKNDIKAKLEEVKQSSEIHLSELVNDALAKHLQNILSGDSDKIRVASLFSGCGGMDVGFTGDFESLGKKYDDLGFEIGFANDISQDACITHDGYFKHKSTCLDIKKYLDGNGVIPDCDVVIGGFPCQDFSLAGKRGGFNTERGRLYEQMKRVIVLKHPLIFVAENVKGLTNLAGALERIKNDFASIYPGYRISDHLLMAADYGVPQTRERVIIVGVRNDCLTDFYPPSPTHAFDESNEDGRKQWVSAKEAIEDLWGTENKNNCLPNQGQYSQAKNYGEHLQGNKSIKADYPGPTIRAEHHGNIEFHYKKKRRLTVRECARIQSFPDNFVFKGSGSSAYVQVGNAVPPILGWYIAKSVRDFIDNERKIKKEKSESNKQNNVVYSR
ncbi:MAG TPA: DNA (cytosine-5-)-methyltransferase [Candidatus Omnitrophica bacterium]|nr:DNA (cytosine-5-)-methyltransferase [Candidatus Omnitrophota bacterium]